MIEYVNQFCTVISTSIGFIIDILLLFFSGKFAVESLKLKRFTGERPSSFVNQCLRVLTIPLTLLIFFSWLWKVPGYIHQFSNSGEYFSLGVVSIFNLLVIAPALYCFVKFRNWNPVKQFRELEINSDSG